eukprot:3102693-Rhodomonas_salina.1
MSYPGTGTNATTTTTSSTRNSTHDKRRELVKLTGIAASKRVHGQSKQEVANRASKKLDELAKHVILQGHGAVDADIDCCDSSIPRH